MRFIILRKADADTEAEVMPGEALLDAMSRYNDTLVDAGAMLDGQGLKASRYGARVRFADGRPRVTEGPFAETRELIAGYTVIRADSLGEAIEWAKGWPPLDGNGNAELELRQLLELEDFAPSEALQRIGEQFEREARQPAGCCPYLFFSGDCREAMETYADCLGGTVEVMLTYRETPAAADVSPGWRDRIVHARIAIGRWQLMGSDASPEHYDPPRGFRVQIGIDDPVRAEQAFNRLAEGGRVCMPLGETFWAQRFGMLVDRFGTPWMINCE